MNSYTFVPKLQNLSSQQVSQPSTILQRLQQLKQSMRPAQSLEQEYSSVQPNSNPTAQLNSAVQNQRLFQYLPKETQVRLFSKQNEEGMQDYESYRKSLEKKLNSLFEKEKHIMKTQSTYQPLNHNLSSIQEYQRKGQSHQRQYTDELQTKYNQLKQNHIPVAKNDRTSNQSQIYDQRQYKAHSTIETNYMYRGPHLFGQKDQEIDQMERKIKMLEMKYLGSYSQQSGSPNQLDIRNEKEGKIALSSISEMVPKNNGSKSNKTKYRKQKTSPDKVKKKHHTSQKQTLENASNSNVEEKAFKSIGKNDKKTTLSPPNKKHPIKDYMNTIEHQASQQNQNDTNEANSLLHKEFRQLKRQFHSLLQINKSMIEKVQMNEQERFMKKQKKQRAKAMLKEILFRLEEIKMEMKGQGNSNLKTVKSKLYGAERVKSKSEHEVRFQKSSNSVIEKKTIERPEISQQKFFNLSNQKSKEFNDKKESSNQNQFKQPSKSQVQKLKKLLDLEVQHRHIVERKLQVLQGVEILTQS